MQDSKITTHVPMPPETPAFFCGNCGAVALNAHNICNPQGKVRKKDWCGSEDKPPAKFCRNRVNNERYRCNKCGKTAINSALLCEPQKLPLPE